jgi:hypothetical protein
MLEDPWTANYGYFKLTDERRAEEEQSEQEGKDRGPIFSFWKLM